MVEAGIEAMNVYAGTAYLDVRKLAEHRGLDMRRFDNLLMKRKSVPLPYEDPITFAVNAAKPLVDALSAQEKQRIEMVVTCTESAFDFGKSMSTYCHDLLGLNRNWRLFEVKNACFSGVAGFQNAVNFILAQVSPGAKVLVIATDMTRFMVEKGGNALTMEGAFAEPSGGAGAVALLVSDTPYVFRVDPGACGSYGYEVMDTCRPSADAEAGDSDLSLRSYLDCSDNAFLEYQKRVQGADYAKTFGYLAYHTPFGGMVKGAHRNLMRKHVRGITAPEIEADFLRRLGPGLSHCQHVGNIMGATTMLSLASTIDNGEFAKPQRIGVFSYGSGCCSEFFSGVATQEGQTRIRALKIRDHLDRRYELSMNEYDNLLVDSSALRFGTRNLLLDRDVIPGARRAHGRPTLFLKEINEYHRLYEWVS
jgi:polyketide biosynthesis 3-hydroxy-3-methylglutaryl-CoA synthase-like enzyme PksG